VACLLALTAGGPTPHDPDAQLAELARRIAAEPGNAVLRWQRGEVLARCGQPRAALADLDAALALDPDFADAHLARACTLLETGHAAQARAALQPFLARRPQAAAGLWTQARVLAALGERAAAAAAGERALAAQVSPRPEHYLECAGALAALGDEGCARAVAVLDAGMRALGPLVALTEGAVGLDVRLRRFDSAVRRLDALIGTIARPARWVRWRDEIRARGGASAGASLAVPAPLAAAAPAPLALPAAPPLLDGEVALVPRGAIWRYLDDGSNQGAAWRQPAFNDAAWASGRAQLGYGDGDEATIVGYGPDPLNKYVTTYFRHAFQVRDRSVFPAARLLLQLDDGAVVYLNGTEVARRNLPAGAIAHTTLATTVVAGAAENTFLSIPIDAVHLVNGTNVLAVEIHQVDPASSDISFDVELRAGDGAPIVTRGPYLQRGAPNAAVLRWRTSVATPTVVWVGPDPNNLLPVFFDATQRWHHEAALAGLAPDTAYHYAIGEPSGVIAGGDGAHTFRTPPAAGTDKPVRVWAIGDSGTANAAARAVRDAYLGFTGARGTDVWLMLGDNAYNFGTELEYQAAVFDTYPSLLRTTFLWPTLGNHDAYSARSATQTGVYYELFTLPKNAEAGGLPSGTEAYYSFDHGPVHFVCLDSQDTNRTAAGAMMSWLRADLANTTARWIIAYWHHPPYTKGSHNSDTDDEGFDPRMREMRERALPILEAAGVDLVLTGHSHSYERSFLLDGHYGVSSTLTPAMKRDRGNGVEAGDGAYGKHAVRKGANQGAVYIVAGSSGKISGGPLDHPAMVVSVNTLGSMVIDVDGGRLDARFLQSDGRVLDHFTLIKGAALTRNVPKLSVSAGGRSDLSLDAGPGEAANLYLALGSFGTTPGFALGGVHVPLNPDQWFQLTLLGQNSVLFPASRGVLDATGRAQSAVVLPPNTTSSLIGASVFHAFIVLDASINWRMASNPVKITFVP
jgi:tetratricopeptide (TPR) repeat protein